MSKSLPPVLLIIEESDDDFVAFERILLEFSIDCRLYRFVNGEDALQYLLRKGKYANSSLAPRPSLILLDLNLSGSGKATLQQFKQYEDLRSIPVIALSGSDDPKEVAEFYHLGVNSYMLKPFNTIKFKSSMQLLVEYWFIASTLPSPEDSI